MKGIPLISVLSRLKQVDLCEFKPTPAYIAGPRPGLELYSETLFGKIKYSYHYSYSIVLENTRTYFLCECVCSCVVCIHVCTCLWRFELDIVVSFFSHSPTSVFHDFVCRFKHMKQ